VLCTALSTGRCCKQEGPAVSLLHTCSEAGHGSRFSSCFSCHCVWHERPAAEGEQHWLHRCCKEMAEQWCRLWTCLQNT